MTPATQQKHDALRMACRRIAMRLSARGSIGTDAEPASPVEALREVVADAQRELEQYFAWEREQQKER